MSDRIKVHTERVRHTAGHFRQAHHTTRQVHEQFTQLVNQLQGEWEGTASQRFYDDFAQWKTTMTQYSQQLHDIGEELDGIAIRFSEADQEL